MKTELPLVKTKWTTSDLHGKTVEFQMTVISPDGMSDVAGNGKFVAESHDDLMLIEIAVVQHVQEGQPATTMLRCAQRNADKIQRQYAGSNFDFSLFDC